MIVSVFASEMTSAVLQLLSAINMCKLGFQSPRRQGLRLLATLLSFAHSERLNFFDAMRLTNASGTRSSVLWALSPPHWIQIYSFHPRMFEADSQKSISWGITTPNAAESTKFPLPFMPPQATRTRRPITPNCSG